MHLYRFFEVSLVVCVPRDFQYKVIFREKIYLFSLGVIFRFRILVLRHIFLGSEILVVQLPNQDVLVVLLEFSMKGFSGIKLGLCQLSLIRVFCPQFDPFFGIQF